MILQIQYRKEFFTSELLWQYKLRLTYWKGISKILLRTNFHCSKLQSTTLSKTSKTYLSIFIYQARTPFPTTPLPRRFLIFYLRIRDMKYMSLRILDIIHSGMQFFIQKSFSKLTSILRSMQVNGSIRKFRSLRILMWWRLAKTNKINKKSKKAVRQGNTLSTIRRMKTNKIYLIYSIIE